MHCALCEAGSIEKMFRIQNSYLSKTVAQKTNAGSYSSKLYEKQCVHIAIKSQLQNQKHTSWLHHLIIVIM